MVIFINKGNSMLRDTDYMKIAEEYSTSIGVATMINYMERVDVVKKNKLYGDDSTINEMVSMAVEEGIYQRFIRKVYELQKGRRGRIKDSTIYKRAYQLCE
jgi:hypothetical protein